LAGLACLFIGACAHDPPAPPQASGEAPQRLQGLYSYMADAGFFVDCASGRRLPVAQEGDNAALESAYARARSTPGGKLLATVDRVSGSSGCNRLMGGYRVEGEALTFDQLAGTRMACAEGMETEKAFLDALARVARWRISGDKLELLDAGGRLLATFEARDMK
jgi:hypothetical protein